jgi:hypothetical protein
LTVKGFEVGYCVTHGCSIGRKGGKGIRTEMEEFIKSGELCRSTNSGELGGGILEDFTAVRKLG